jgi:hypothetical protein
MGGIPHDHYEPKSKSAKAFHARLPIVGLLYDTLMFPTPKNLLVPVARFDGETELVIGKENA